MQNNHGATDCSEGRRQETPPVHELSICEGLLKVVLSELGRLSPDAKLIKVRVAVGALRQVVPESLTFAYETLSENTRAAGSTLEIVDIPITVRCRKCGWEGNIEQRLFYCGACRSPDVETLTGKELYLESMEIDEDGTE